VGWEMAGECQSSRAWFGMAIIVSSGVDAAEALLGMAEPPTAIFASNMKMAAGTLAGFGDDAIGSCVWPPLTTTRQATRELGYEAADLLLASGPEHEAGPEHEEHEIPFDLIRRESTAAPPLLTPPK
jgi:LacI family transcriptional regulator